ncbi:MAG: arsenate reductase ArsC [Bosea sp. (in: a-proteobacteria)]
MSNRPLNVLFLCTANSARSILGEGILRALGGERFRSFSAGSHPRGIPNPLALVTLAGHGHDVAGLASKSWDVFGGADAPKMDIVLTVCDAAAGESCPYWPGQPMTVHWGIEDPASDKGTAEEQRAAFEVAYDLLRHRIELMLALPLDTLNTAALKQELKRIGAEIGATDLARAALS